ncbi:nucleoside diphosphate kinase regulator [Tianweitania sp. BSSL-BM11]|uniref:Nucleoside diphosphate kinase regulator n=1 Tax=Tianweitania aestuarii TaxID=2814886 RepID=A0ABS5S0Z4_9HYPH|nr:nucleoside diphosphate kinase regulator [Tianweitania aestuarii]MBS9722207.1 nucleoside diphosphate kinase regulator [Tianweitania aestuarii]
MSSTQTGRKPAIQITQTDYDKLALLADSATHVSEAVLDELSAELDRARIVPDNKLRDKVVRMGSRLRYSTNNGDSRDVTLVFPGEADIAEGRISILTPIGTALIGLSEGQSIEWVARDGKSHRLLVESVGEVAEPQAS